MGDLQWKRCATTGCDTEILGGQPGERCVECLDADESADTLEPALGDKPCEP